MERKTQVLEQELQEFRSSGVQESGVRSQESGVRSQESGVRSQESGVRSQESGVRSHYERHAPKSRAVVDSCARTKCIGDSATPELLQLLTYIP
jgi:hypothetical protein